MLQSMRDLAHSWYFKGLMLVLVVSFGIWNIGDIFRGNPLHQVAASAGSTTFTVQELTRAFERDLANARQSLKPDLTAQQAKQMGMVTEALNNLIEESLFDQDIKRLGIEADNGTVLQLLTQEAAFKDKDGKFDKSLLQNYLAMQRLSEQEFFAQQRKNVASRQLISAFTAIPPASPSVVDLLYKTRGQKRILDIVTFDGQSLPPSPAPDDKVLRDYYQQHPKPFTMPELRGITVAMLSTDSIAKDITISDDQVKKEYDAKKDQLAEPETRDLLQVIVQDEAKAKELAKAAQTSGNLAAAAKPAGHTAIPLNHTDKDSLPPEISGAVFALPEHGVSDPIKTALGWHVLQVRKITPPGLPSYESIKDKLRESMKSDQAGDTVARTVNQLDDELAAGHAVEDLADTMKLRLIKIAGIDAAGNNPEGKYPIDLGYKEDILKAAFGQNNGESSPVMDDKNGHYYVVRTDQVTPSSVKPFEQVRTEVLAAWKNQDQEKRAEAEADTIAKALREGKTAASFANQKGIEIKSSKPISLLDDSDPSLPRSDLPRVLRLKKGEVTVLAPAKDKQVIVRLAQIIPASGTRDEVAQGKIASEYADNKPRELADEYMRYLRVIFPVKIHTDVVDSVAQTSN